jgi:hypothetical protein
MKKKHNYKDGLESYRSYKLKYIADIIDVNIQTLRKWIAKGGLEAFQHEGDYYIYGAILKDYLKAKNTKNKVKLTDTQFKCQSCKKHTEPQNNIITKIEEQKNGNLFIFGICACGYEMHKIWSKNRKEELKTIFLFPQVITRHDSSNPTNKTHFEIIQKEVVSEPYINHTIPTETTQESPSFQKQGNDTKDKEKAIKHAQNQINQLSLL